MGVTSFHILLLGLLSSSYRPCTDAYQKEDYADYTPSGSGELFANEPDVMSTAPETDTIICQDEKSRRPCCLLIKKQMNWTEAHNYCHSRQGWLLNSMYPTPLNMSTEQLVLLLQKNHGPLWSGFHIRQYRLVADNFPIPNSLGDFDSDWDTTEIGGDCVQMQVKTSCPTGSPMESSFRSRRQITCSKRLVKKFTTCGHKFHFICVFEHSFTSSMAGKEKPVIQVAASLDVLQIGNESIVVKPPGFSSRYTAINIEYTIGEDVTVQCAAPTTGQMNIHLQTPVIYNLGVPLPSTRIDGRDYWTATSPIYSHGFVQLYHCDVFDPDSNTVLQSPTIFVRFEDEVIISAHLKVNASDQLERELYKSSLLDSWTPSISEEEEKFWTFIWNMSLNLKPVVFIPRKGDVSAKLVMLVITQSSGFDLVKEEQTKVITEVKKDINDKVKSFPLSEVGISAITLHDMTQCWPSEDQFNRVNKRCSLGNGSNVTNLYPVDITADYLLVGLEQKLPQEKPDNKPMYTSHCEGDRMVGFEYIVTEQMTDCNCSETTDHLKNLSCSAQDPTSDGNNSRSIQEIKDMTGAGSIKKIETISKFADLFSSLSRSSILPDSTVQDCIDIIDSINKSPEDVLKQAQMKSNATQKIIVGLENIGSQVNLQGDHRRFVTESLALEVWNLTYGGNASQTTGLKIENNSSKDLRDNNLVTIKSGNVDFGSVEAAIFLQEEYVKSLTNESERPNIRLVTKAITDPRIFGITSQQSRSNQTSSPKESRSNQTLSPKETRPKINSQIMSMQLFTNGEQVTNLSQYYVTVVFSPLIKTPVEQRSTNSRCAYWDLLANQGTGGWATDMCHYNRTEQGKDVCICYHLTNFVLLLDFNDQDPETDEHDHALSIISTIGLSLSIFGLSLSIVSFLLIKSIRDSLPQKLMFQLSLALLFSWIVFLAGVEQTSSHTVCLMISVLLHYLILSSFMWMLGHGILQHMMIVQVQKAVSPKFLVTYTIIAWGFPIIPVVAVLSVDTELYYGDYYCWMKPPALYYSFALPVGLILVTNIIIFIRIVIRLFTRGRVGQNASRPGNQKFVNVRASIISFCILGLSWTFAFFAIGGPRVVFQYLFCFLVSIQGFLLFAMMVARNHSFQQYWRSIFCWAKTRSHSTSDSQNFNTKDRHFNKSDSNNSALTYKTEIRSDSQHESSH